MAAEGYSTGSIFVQVVPVFKNFQNDIAKEARKANAGAKKDAADLGREQVKQAELTAAQIAKVNERQRTQAEKDELAAAKRIADAKVAQARNANAQQIKDENALRDAESKRIRDQMEGEAKVAKTKAELFEKQTRKEWAENDRQNRAAKSALDRHVADVAKANEKMRSDAIKAEKDVSDFRQKEWERTAGTFARSWQSEMKKASRAISQDAVGEVGKIKREFDRLADTTIGPSVGQISEAEATKIAQQLFSRLRKAGRSRRLNARDLIDVSAAERGLRGFVKESQRAGRAASVLGRGLKGLHQDGQKAANSFRVFNPFLIAVVGTLAVMPALTSAAAGGLLALGTSAAVGATGIAAMVFGFSGLGDAMTALQNKADSSTKEMKAQTDSVKQASYAVSDARKSLADAERSAAQAAEDAARRVADARESAADSIQDALDRQREAQESYRDAIDSVREAEVALADARRQAREDAQDLDLSVRSNKLAQEEGLLNEFDSKVTYDSARADGSATNAEVEQARINWEQAKIQQERLRIEGKRLADEKKKWDKDGVNGSDIVKSAQEQLTDAIKAQREAVKDLGEASRAVDEARSDGAREVADALRDQSRVSADNARSIATAQESLRRAQEQMVGASTEASATADAAAIAMGKLSTSGKAFALFLTGVKSDFRDLRNEIQDVFLPDVQAAFTAIIEKNGPGFRVFMLSMAAVMGAFFTDLATSINGPEMQAFFGAFADFAPLIQGSMNDAFISFLEGLAGVMRAALPFTLAFADGLAALMDRFAAWANSKEGQDALADFFETAAKVGPEVLEFIGSLVGFMYKLGKAMLPISLGILEGLGDFMDFLARQDPAVLQAIGVGLLAVFGFIQIISGAGALSAGILLLGGPLTIIVAAVLALAAAFIYLWTTSETFREKVRAVLGFLQEQFSDKIWGPMQEPLDKLGAAFTRLWEEVIKPFLFNHLIPALEWLGKNVVPVIFAAIGAIIGAVFTIIAWWIEHIVVPGFKILGAIISWLWEWVAKPVFGFIKGAWEVMAAAFVWVWKNVLRPLFQIFALTMEIAWKGIKWAWNKFGQPAVDWITSKLKGLAQFFKWAWNKWGKPAFDAIRPYTLDPLVKGFKWAVGAIGDYWDGLKRVLASPILVGFKIVNSLIDGLNDLGKAVGAKTVIDNVNPPGWLASMGGAKKKSTLTAQGQKNANRFASGGIMPGYTPGRDVHDFYSPTAGRLHLSGGEAIMRPEWTAAMGPGFVNRMNALARMGGADAVRKAMMGGQAYAKGGVFWPLPGGIASTYGGHDGVDLNSPNDMGKPYYAAVGGKIAYVGSGRGYGDAVFQQTKYGTLVYGHSSAIGVRAGQTVKPGQFLGNVGSTGNSSGPHLHFGFPGGSYSQAMALLSGASMAGYGPASPLAEAGGNIPGMVSKLLAGPLDMVKGWAKSALGEMADKFDSPFSKVIADVPKKLFGAVADKAEAMVPGWMKDVASLSPIGSLMGLLGGKATGSTQKQAKTALGEAGFGGWASGSQWAAMRELVQRESSWNPNAKNPTSTATGLFQFLAATMKSYGIAPGASVYDQTVAGAQYIKDRYGSPKAALAFHDRNNWYSDGGVYQAGESTANPGSSLPYSGVMQYDSGGMLPPGLTTVVNLTGKPEKILTDDQWKKVQGGAGGGLTYAPTFNASDLTAGDVAQDLNFTFKALSRGGKYAGVNG